MWNLNKVFNKWGGVMTSNTSKPIFSVKDDRQTLSEKKSGISG